MPHSLKIVMPIAVVDGSAQGGCQSTKDSRLGSQHRGKYRQVAVAKVPPTFIVRGSLSYLATQTDGRVVWE